MDYLTTIDKFKNYKQFMCNTGAISLSCTTTILQRFGKFTKWIDIENITLDDVIEFCKYLAITPFTPKSGGKAKLLQHNTRMKYIRTIKDFIRWCAINGLSTIKRELFPKRKKQEKEMEILEEEEVFSFFELAKKEKNEIIRVRNELFLRIAYFTSIRYSENLNLTFDKVLSGKPFQIFQKWGRLRTVSITEKSWIRQLSLQLKTLYNMKKNKKYIEDKDYLYLNVSNQYRGKRRWINWPRYELIKYIKELKFKRHITMHTFRHSHATHLLDKWADLKSVQLSLWHKFITTTEIYTHLSSKFLENTLCLLWNDS